MKKLLAFLLACASVFPLRGQQHQNCTTDESILLNERPAGISERDALDLIRGSSSQFIASYENEKKYSQLIDFPFSRLNVFEKRAKITLEKKAKETLPRWQTAPYYVYVRTEGLESYWFGLSTGFFAMLLFGLAIINGMHDNLKWKDGGTKIRLAIVGNGLLISIAVGVFLYVISAAAEFGPENSLSGQKYKFVWWEAAFQVGGVFAGFLVYVGGHHLRLLTIKHKEAKKRVLSIS